MSNAFPAEFTDNERCIMANELQSQSNPSHPVIYQIRIRGHLGAAWADWFEGMTITLAEGGDTLLTGPVIDQAALHGLLKKVRDLGMPLLSISTVEPGSSAATDVAEGGLPI